MRSHADPERVKEVYRAEHRRMLLGQIDGLSITLAALDGREPDAYGNHLARVRREVLQRAKDHPAPLEERFAKAQERYVFLGSTRTPLDCVA